MNKVKLTKLILLLTLLGLIFAHGPTRQKVPESVTIKINADSAWLMISDLVNIGDWHSQYKSIKEKGEELQPISMFTGENGVVQILALDPEKKMFKYRLKNPGDIPLNNYSARLRVEEIDSENVKITYKGAFY